MDSSAQSSSASSAYQPPQSAQGQRPTEAHRQTVSPEPIGQASHRDGLQGLSGFQLHETVTRHLHSRRYSAALLTLAAGQQADRKTSWFWHLQGEVLANLGRYQDALVSFDRALEIAPGHIETLVFQAVCDVHLQRYPQALERCDRALELAPYHTQAWLFRGVALQRLGQYTDAYRSYDAALRSPRPVRSHPLRQLAQQSITYCRNLSRTCRRWLSQAS